ncbi:MAG: hypothetical protein ACXWQ5_05025 [Ktedonobacterales bacterium]
MSRLGGIAVFAAIWKCAAAVAGVNPGAAGDWLVWDTGRGFAVIAVFADFLAGVVAGDFVPTTRRVCMVELIAVFCR